MRNIGKTKRFAIVTLFRAGLSFPTIARLFTLSMQDVEKVVRASCHARKR